MKINALLDVRPCNVAYVCQQIDRRDNLNDTGKSRLPETNSVSYHVEKLGF
jgi:hypothetical protein